LCGFLAKKNPKATVLGIDIEPVHPPYTLPNCRFQIMDATDDWAFDVGLDFVHVRMLGDLADKPRLVQSIFDSLNPGGWVEITEWIVQLQSPNHSFEGTAFHRWNLLLRQGMLHHSLLLF
jgi:trans-aconitate methyltransferase